MGNVIPNAYRIYSNNKYDNQNGEVLNFCCYVHYKYFNFKCNLNYLYFAALAGKKFFKK